MKKGGAITRVDRKELTSVASSVLSKIKNSKKEKNKIPYRVDKNTIIMVSKKKYDKLIKENGKNRQ